jgi:hypothetical protein
MCACIYFFLNKIFINDNVFFFYWQSGLTLTGMQMPSQNQYLQSRHETLKGCARRQLLHTCIHGGGGKPAIRRPHR